MGAELHAAISYDGFARLAADVCGVEAGVVLRADQGELRLVGASALRAAAAQVREGRLFRDTLQSERLLELTDRQIIDVATGGKRAYRFYAGIPLRLRGTGEPVGVLGVLDPRPVTLRPQQRTGLELVAQGLAAMIAEGGVQAAPVWAPSAKMLLSAFAQAADPVVLYSIGEPGQRPQSLGGNHAFERLAVGSLPRHGESPLTALRGPRTDSEVLGAMEQAARLARPMRATIALHRPHEAQPRWFTVHGYPIAIGGRAVYWVEHLHEQTDHVQRYAVLASERNRLQRTLASMADAVMTLDLRGHLRFMNRAARALLDLREVLSAEQLADADERLLCLRDIETDEPLEHPFTGPMRHAKSVKGRAVITTRSKALRYLEYVVAEIERPQAPPDGYVVILRDVTAEERLTRRLSFEAGHDELTGVANRRAFEQVLAQAVASPKAEGESHTLAFLDLDRFKAINDACGHIAGDRLLRDVAQLFSSQVRGHDVLARFGGDEFAILMRNCPLAVAARVIERMRTALSTFRWTWQEREYTIGVSIGLAEITASTTSAEAVLQAADAACYADKAQRRTPIPPLPLRRSHVL